MSSAGSMEWEEDGQNEEWEDWEEDGEEDRTKSLFSDAVLPTQDEAIQHDKDIFGFDLRHFVAANELGEYDVIKLITAIRKGVRAGTAPAEVIASLAQRSWWDTEDNLIPVDPSDPLLFFDVGTADFERAAADADPPRQGTKGGVCLEDVGPSVHDEGKTATLKALQEENDLLRDALESLRGAMGPGWTEEEEAGPSGTGLAGSSHPLKEKVERAYFGSYSGLAIHREMLSDTVRTRAYMDALEGNPGLIGGARVLDVGCGTGVLSMFAARGGARRVVGVDGSQEIAALAEANVKANGMAFSDGGVVSIVAGTIEDINKREALADGVDEVDVVVSEWMGYALLFETMLPSVIEARDRWLRPGGAMLPDRARLLVALGGTGSSGMTFWDQVYGLRMSPVREHLRADAMKSGIVREVASDDVLSEPCLLQEFDLVTVRTEDLQFNADFRLVPRDGKWGQEVHSLVLWFDTPFTERFCKEKPVMLSTSPHLEQTHWVQTVFVLRHPITLGEGETLEGVLSYANAEEHRALDISITCSVCTADGTRRDTQSNVYNMSVVG